MWLSAALVSLLLHLAFVLLFFATPARPAMDWFGYPGFIATVLAVKVFGGTGESRFAPVLTFLLWWVGNLSVYAGVVYGVLRASRRNQPAMDWWPNRVDKD
jgi:hypothetical protein